MQGRGGLWGLLVLIPCYWLAWMSPAIGIYHDDSIYLTTARALAEGRGYRIESVPKSVAQTKYPVLYPAVLALGWKVAPEFPGNVWIFKGISLAWLGLWLGLAWWLLRRLSGSEGVAAAVVVAVAASPQVVFLSTAVLSETMFAALATATLCCLCRYQEKPGWRWAAASAVLAAMAYHTRSIGICLMGAGAVAVLWQRRWREAALYTALAGGLSAPWLLWQYANREARGYLSYANYYTGYNAFTNFGWAEKVEIVGKNFFFLLASPEILFGLPFGIWVGAALGCLALPFWVRGLGHRETPRGVALWGAFSLLVILFWAWPPPRFVVPMLPFFLYFVWRGAPGRGRGVLVALFWLAAGMGAVASYRHSGHARESGMWLPGNYPLASWREYEAQLDWLRREAPVDAVIQSNVDPTVFLFTGRRAIRGSEGNASLKMYVSKPEPLGSAEDFRANLLRQGVSYVVLTPWNWFIENPFLDTLVEECRKRHPQEFTLVHQGKQAGFVIYRFQAGGMGKIPAWNPTN